MHGETMKNDEKKKKMNISVYDMTSEVSHYQKIRIQLTEEN
jgi:hypothetical protein